MSAPASTPVTGDAGRALAEVPGLASLQGPGDVATRYAGALMGTYGTPQRVLVRGEGAWVWDDRGRRYLDLLAGIAVNALGHAHPVLTAAVTAQMATLGHVSNFFATGPQVALAERLLELLGAPDGSRVFLCSSGAEANEGAFKMARRTGRWFASAGPDGRVDADVVTLAKGLGGGLPVGAVVGLGEGPGALLGAGQHGTTFGGNPVCAAAALAVLHVVERDGLVGRAASLGARWAADLAAVDDPTGLLAGVRGEGLLLALRLARPEAPAVAAAALDAGFVVNAVAPDAVRLAPPLVLTDEQADSFTAALPGVLAAADASSRAPGATP